MAIYVYMGVDDLTNYTTMSTLMSSTTRTMAQNIRHRRFDGEKCGPIGLGRGTISFPIKSFFPRRT